VVAAGAFAAAAAAKQVKETGVRGTGAMTDMGADQRPGPDGPAAPGPTDTAGRE
jgi:hypothetical protein